MNDYKIIQIIPNTKELYAKYKDADGEFTSPIVCFSLVEYEDGEREVIPMDICGDGEINKISSNLIDIIEKPII